MAVRLTCRRSPNHAELAGNVHHAASNAGSAIVGGQRLLLEHLLYSRAG